MEVGTDVIVVAGRFKAMRGVVRAHGREDIHIVDLDEPTAESGPYQDFAEKELRLA